MEPSITGPLGESGQGSLEVAKGEEGHHALYTAVCIVSATTFLEAGGSYGLHGPPETTEHQTESGLESVFKPTVPLLHLGAFADMAELGQSCLLCFVSCLQTRSQMHHFPTTPGQSIASEPAWWPLRRFPQSRTGFQEGTSMFCTLPSVAFATRLESRIFNEASRASWVFCSVSFHLLTLGSTRVVFLCFLEGSTLLVLPWGPHICHSFCWKRFPDFFLGDFYSTLKTFLPQRMFLSTTALSSVSPLSLPCLSIICNHFFLL